MQAVASRNTVAFHTEDFDGPLDLLLALIMKNKMKIYEIEIVTLIDQYLQVVQTLGPEHLDSASEFVSMAAHLVQVKSALLLPKSEEGERLREELTGLLVEYSACKEVAAKMRDMYGRVFLAVREPLPFETDERYTFEHDLQELTEAFGLSQNRRHIRQAPSQEQFNELVAAPFVSVSSRVIGVLRSLLTGRAGRLRDLFVKGRSRSETVATFLAVLELMREGRVSIDSEGRMEVQNRKTRKKA